MQERPPKKRTKRIQRPQTDSLSDYDADIQDVIENSIYEPPEPEPQKEDDDD